MVAGCFNCRRFLVLALALCSTTRRTRFTYENRTLELSIFAASTVRSLREIASHEFSSLRGSIKLSISGPQRCLDFPIAGNENESARSICLRSPVPRPKNALELVMRLHDAEFARQCCHRRVNQLWQQSILALVPPEKRRCAGHVDSWQDLPSKRSERRVACPAEIQNVPA